MASQNQYFQKMHEAALQGVVTELVKEKEDVRKSITARDSYMTNF